MVGNKRASHHPDCARNSCPDFSLRGYAASWPSHQFRNQGYGRWIIGEHHGQILRSRRSLAVTFHHHFDGTTAGAVNARHFPLSAVRPEDPHRDAHFFNIGIENRDWVSRAIYRESLALAIIQQD